jgi:hypothetical protein
MSRTARALCLAAGLLTVLSACEGDVGKDASVDASALPDGGDSGLDAGPPEPPAPDGSTPGPDGSTPGPDGSTPGPDAQVPLDAGPQQPDGGPCGSSGCAEPDLVVDLPTEALALSYRNVEISEDDCDLFEGCVGGTGSRSLVEISFTLRNQGEAALELGRPFENPLYYPSFCQDAYVIDGFFAAEILDADGDVVASGRLSTSCIAGSDGDYTCRAQGLSPDEASAQPIGRCDFLDITGLGGGDYTLVVTANADHAVRESDYDNNSSQLSFHYTPCDGTVCGGECCPAGVQCYADTCMLPDLHINEDSAEGSLWITHQTFGEDSCEMAEMCVNGDGRRRLLQFEGRIENLGPGDLNPGPEANNPLYEFSECHGHYHFLDFTDYRLLNEDGSVAAFGHKQSFCLIDMVQVEGAVIVAPPGTRPPPGETGCSYLSAGWADIYGVGTPCQWVDITDVPAGNYLLQLTVNPENSVLETNTENNIVTISVTISEDVPCEPGQPEICGDDIDQDCDDTPDEYDDDCYSCSPFDPYCESIEEVSDNYTCEDAYEMAEATTYETWIDQDNASDVSSSCGGEGGDAFFTFTLASEQAVFLGTMGSTVDTVLSLYANDCEGQQLRCQDDACNGTASQLVDVLPAGRYTVAIKAKDAGDFGRVRLKLEHADAHGAIPLEGPGVYAGDTSVADDSVQACSYSYPEPEPDGGVPMGDGGVSEEVCVHTVEGLASGVADHECLHCACGVDSDAVSACDATCWNLIECAFEECGGGGNNVSCVITQCSEFVSAATPATQTVNALDACPNECGASGGMGGSGSAGSAGGSIGGGGPVGGMGPLGGSSGINGMSGAGGIGGGVTDGGVGPGGANSPDDIYVLAACGQSVTVSTCGSSTFDSVIELRSQSLDNYSDACSESYNLCNADGNGAATNLYTYGAPGLTFIVVEGTSESATGEYQMSVIY